MVKVLVGKRPELGEQLSGFWAEFAGEAISSYEDKGILYTLYRCSAYDFAAYRVHIADETDHKNPTYDLLPHPQDQRDPSPDISYVKPYHDYDVAFEYPLFLKHIDYLPRYNVDPGPRA